MFNVCCIKKYNDLPAAVVESSTISAFKTGLAKYLGDRWFEGLGLVFPVLSPVFWCNSSCRLLILFFSKFVLFVCLLLSCTSVFGYVS